MNDQAINAAIDLLRSRGFVVSLPVGSPRWITPSDLARELGIPPATLLLRLRRPSCPPFESRSGESGRLVAVLCTAELRAFLGQEKRPGKRLAMPFLGR